MSSIVEADVRPDDGKDLAMLEPSENRVKDSADLHLDQDDRGEDQSPREFGSRS